MTKDFLRSAFTLLCIGAAIIFLYPVLVFPKGELELLINKYHYPALDIFFKYITHLGDGAFLGILLLILLFVNYSSTIITAFSVSIQAIIVSLFKRWLFKGMERPLGFFEDGIALNFVEGVDVHNFNTFPSGHTATAFALFGLIFLVVKKHDIFNSTLLFALAFCVGFSRVYLLQHFVVDVYFGAIFGVLSVILGLWMFELIFKKDKIQQLNNSSLKQLIFKNRR